MSFLHLTPVYSMPLGPKMAGYSSFGIITPSFLHQAINSSVSSPFVGGWKKSIDFEVKIELFDYLPKLLKNVILTAFHELSAICSLITPVFISFIKAKPHLYPNF